VPTTSDLHNHSDNRNSRSVTASPPEIERVLRTVERRGSATIGIAGIEDGAIAWTAGAGGGDDALFQAGSLSKSVTAAVVLELVRRGELDLDTDVDERLSSWSPASGAAITLRHLLGHTAGVNVPFYPGYPQGAPVPSLLQSLEGVEPATTPAVTVDAKGAGRFRYSGGGYAVVQQLIEDVRGEPFAEAARQAVFDPLGMERSSFRQPPEQLRSPAWADWRFYPEEAAAGMWTTPADLARFVCALQAALRGGGGELGRETAVAMTTPHARLPYRGQWTVLSLLGLRFPRQAGLGLFVREHRFVNLGGAAGSFSALTGSTENGTGAVVMTAGCRSGLAVRVLLEIGDARGWTDLRAFPRGIRRETSDLLLRALS
jgi:CubicO group peptidase (beta-lactamase class C family)